ncbi:AAA family ATPase [Pseudomonas monsensis]
MIIKAIRLNISTREGEFGFAFSFDRNLTIIRGSNSSGKSTVFNSILYAFGMEELVGGKNQASLPYALKDYFEFEGEKVFVEKSEILLEVENRVGDIVTFRRSITDEQKSPKLVEVLNGPYLTEGVSTLSTFKYLHDGGGAQYDEGFHTYLESFLGFKLPFVAGANGRQVKLYLQAVFAAVAVEQKRGWTDYIANIPHYGIRDVRVKVVELLLGLDVFELASLRSELNNEAVEIDGSWNDSYKELFREVRSLNVRVDVAGLPVRVASTIDFSKVSVGIQSDGARISLVEYIAKLREKFKALELQIEIPKNDNSLETVAALSEQGAELSRLVSLYESALSTLAVHKSSLSLNKQLVIQANEELIRNKSSQKLQKFGALLGLSLSKEQCPTCHQHVDDSLTASGELISKMDVQTNIEYLESQLNMLRRQQDGINVLIRNCEMDVQNTQSAIVNVKSILSSLRKDVASGNVNSRALVKQQIFIEEEIVKLQRFDDLFGEIINIFKGLSNRLKVNQERRTSLPKIHYSEDDGRVLDLFEKMFRANVGEFDYHSAPVRDIEIDFDSLLPFLKRLELRVVRDAVEGAELAVHHYQAGKSRNNIAADSSASDFVRLIWSYLLAIYQTSTHSTVNANHPGILLFDEPGQHSMATKSQRALFQMLSGDPKLQSIVAASFDDSEPVFKESTEGLQFKLIQLNEKSITRF